MFSSRVLTSIITIQIAILFLIGMPVYAMADDSMAHDVIAGNWRGSDGKIYKIRFDKNYCYINRPIKGGWRTYGAKRKDAAPTLSPRHHFVARYKPKTIDDFNPGLPIFVRKMLLKTSADFSVDVHFGRRKAGEHSGGYILDEEYIQLTFYDVYGVALSPGKPMVVRNRVEHQVILRPADYICGPDVTDNVAAVIEQMYQDFQNNWKPSDRKKRCEAALDYLKGRWEMAWDIIQFAPGSHPIYGAKVWAWKCARPRNECGKTVAFGRQCVHYQVLNYLQWGVIYELCKNKFKAIVLHWTRDTFTHLPLIHDRSVHYQKQNMFARIGSVYVKFRRDMEKPPQGLLVKLFQAELRLMAKRENLSTEWKNRDSRKCKLRCQNLMTERERSSLANMKFKYQWGDYGPRANPRR